MGVAGGMGIFKFSAVVILGVLFLNMFAGAIGGAIEWKKTGNWKPFVDNTLGQIIYFDGKIAIAMEQITNDEISSKLPESLQKDYKAALAKQVLTYLLVFIIIGYMLFRVGNWASGKSQLDPLTDFFIIVIIIGVLFTSELLYAWLMDKPHIMAFRGFYFFFKDFGAWFNALSGTFNVVPMEQAIAPMTEIVAENAVVLT